MSRKICLLFSALVIVFACDSMIRAADEPVAGQSGKKKVAFMAGRPSHGYGAHEHYAGCMVLANALRESMPNIDVEVFRNGWPEDAAAFEGADAIVMYCDGGGGHPVNQHLEQVDTLAEKGVGIVCIHYGVEVPARPAGEYFLKWIGGYFEANWSVNPHWTAKFEKFPDHPITRGVQPFEINDEWYYHMRFRPDMEGVTPILTDMPSPDTLKRPDGSHSGNPDVRAAVLQRKERQHVAWASERANGQRGFGFTGGHNHWNWGDDNFRKLVLNAIVWAAHGEVPKSGVTDQRLTVADLEANQDEPQPANFNGEALQKQFNLPASKDADSPKTSSAPTRQRGNLAGARPVFASEIISAGTPGHAVDVTAEIAGAKQLYLIVRDGGDGFGCDWADWAEPVLIGPAGKLKLTELKWKSATSDWGRVSIDRNAGGQPMQINGQSVEFGIGTHANSAIVFDLPEGYTHFKARVGVDNGGTNQGCGSTVQFFVFTQQPNAQLLARGASGGGGSASHEAADAVDQLDVHPDLDAAVFAAEPMMFNPTNIDIDHLGRVWVCEVLNYRRFRNNEFPERTEGDRILILEDTNGDGEADKSTVFYQGRDIDSAHGILVLGTPSGKGTRALVSAGDSVFWLIDDDGDSKADRKEVMFTGISGVQHDHGIHAFVFGPDGKLYFNFGNEGKQLRDREGKPVTDMAGNVVNDQHKPYQQGMVFRCNLDGSQVETLGWNFRNNWEVCIDSFGTLWQSDNDDDGNKGVRINYVMEFGNYGYRDEKTGAGWQAERTGWEDEIPRRHWHLNDPGVVPNLLQTGAGSPTGICVYEGMLLPEEFRGQVIHCDAGPNIVRAYPVEPDGAGYKAETINILDGSKRNQWFRPSDVCVAPDGSLIVADWYDPGVGGHRMQDVEHGRLFRVTPRGGTEKYTFAKPDFSSLEGAAKALNSPNLATRSIAWTVLHDAGAKAETVLRQQFENSDDPRASARALWLLGQIDGRGAHYVEAATNDSNADIRIVGVRLARELDVNLVPIAKKLAHDPSPQVRRDVAIALRHHKSPDAAQVWAELASQHDGQDRWYLEALGIGADGNWDSYLAAWLEQVGDKWNTPGGRDIIWRSRAKNTPAYLAKILTDPSTPPETQARYFRAFDFLDGPEKDAALKTILGL